MPMHRKFQIGTKAGDEILSFYFKSKEYRLFDCVLLESENPREPYVGKIEKVDALNPKDILLIRWFFKPSDIPPEKRPKNLLENELFLAVGNPLYFTGIVDRNPLEALIRTTKVLYLNDDKDNLKPTSADLKAADYVFRSFWDVETNSILSYEELGPIDDKLIFNKPEWVPISNNIQSWKCRQRLNYDSSSNNARDPNGFTNSDEWERTRDRQFEHGKTVNFLEKPKKETEYIHKKSRPDKYDSMDFSPNAVSMENQMKRKGMDEKNSSSFNKSMRTNFADYAGNHPRQFGFDPRNELNHRSNVMSRDERRRKSREDNEYHGRNFDGMETLNHYDSHSRPQDNYDENDDETGHGENNDVENDDDKSDDENDGNDTRVHGNGNHSTYDNVVELQHHENSILKEKLDLLFNINDPTKSLPLHSNPNTLENSNGGHFEVEGDGVDPQNLYIYGGGRNSHNKKNSEDNDFRNGEKNLDDRDWKRKNKLENNQNHGVCANDTRKVVGEKDANLQRLKIKIPKVSVAQHSLPNLNLMQNNSQNSENPLESIDRMRQKDQSSGFTLKGKSDVVQTRSENHTSEKMEDVRAVEKESGLIQNSINLNDSQGNIPTECLKGIKESESNRNPSTDIFSPKLPSPPASLSSIHPLSPRLNGVVKTTTEIEDLSKEEQSNTLYEENLRHDSPNTNVNSAKDEGVRLNSDKENVDGKLTSNSNKLLVSRERLLKDNDEIECGVEASFKKDCIESNVLNSETLGGNENGILITIDHENSRASNDLGILFTETEHFDDFKDAIVSSQIEVVEQTQEYNGNCLLEEMKVDLTTEKLDSVVNHEVADGGVEKLTFDLNISIDEFMMPQEILKTFEINEIRSKDGANEEEFKAKEKETNGNGMVENNKKEERHEGEGEKKQTKIEETVFPMNMTCIDRSQSNEDESRVDRTQSLFVEESNHLNISNELLDLISTDCIFTNPDERKDNLNRDLKTSFINDGNFFEDKGIRANEDDENVMTQVTEIVHNTTTVKEQIPVELGYPVDTATIKNPNQEPENERSMGRNSGTGMDDEYHTSCQGNDQNKNNEEKFYSMEGKSLLPSEMSLPMNDMITSRDVTTETDSPLAQHRKKDQTSIRRSEIQKSTSMDESKKEKRGYKNLPRGKLKSDHFQSNKINNEIDKTREVEIEGEEVVHDFRTQSMHNYLNGKKRRVSEWKNGLSSYERKNTEWTLRYGEIVPFTKIRVTLMKWAGLLEYGIEEDRVLLLENIDKRATADDISEVLETLVGGVLKTKINTNPYYFTTSTTFSAYVVFVKEEYAANALQFLCTNALHLCENSRPVVASKPKLSSSSKAQQDHSKRNILRTESHNIHTKDESERNHIHDNAHEERSFNETSNNSVKKCVLDEDKTTNQISEGNLAEPFPNAKTSKNAVREYIQSMLPKTKTHYDQRNLLIRRYSQPNTCEFRFALEARLLHEQKMLAFKKLLEKHGRECLELERKQRASSKS